MSKYIEIRDEGESATGKTRIWGVWNIRTNEKLGRIAWRGANGWRGYAFFIDCEGLDWLAFDSKCLRKITEFLEEVNGKKV